MTVASARQGTPSIEGQGHGGDLNLIRCEFPYELLVALNVVLRHRESVGHFAPIRIPSQSLTLDFDNRESFQPQHYAFKVSEVEFDEIFGRVKEEGLSYGSGPFSPEDGEINRWNGGRGVYFRDPNGHLLELLTRDYTAEQFNTS